jgi:hypothetical protein
MPAGVTVRAVARTGGAVRGGSAMSAMAEADEDVAEDVVADVVEDVVEEIEPATAGAGSTRTNNTLESSRNPAKSGRASTGLMMRVVGGSP